jgi:signal transduction histidine kinase
MAGEGGGSSVSGERQSVLNDPILASLPHGLCAVDAEGKILAVNPALEGLLGGSLAAQLGRPLSRFLEERIVDPAQVLCWTVALHEALAFGRTTFLNLSADFWGAQEGQTVSLTGVVAPWDDGCMRQGALVVFHDSARHNTLEDVRHRFLSVVSHELGSPLTNVSAAADRLARLVGGRGAEEWKLLQIIRGETARLRRLLGQFLSPSPEHTGGLRPARTVITLRPLFHRVVHTYRVREFDHEIEVQVAPDLPFVWGDADRIQEVLSNLVDNALRYAPPGSRVLVAAEGRQDDVMVVVADQGQGVPEATIERIFEPLFRGDGERQAGGGQGLGLYVSKNLIQTLGGDLWYEHEEGGGARFCFTLPRAKGLPGEDEEDGPWPRRS